MDKDVPNRYWEGQAYPWKVVGLEKDPRTFRNAACWDGHQQIPSWTVGHPQIFKSWLVFSPQPQGPPPQNPALIMGFWRRESPDAPVIGFWWTKSPLAPGKTAPGGLRDTAARQNAAPDVAFLNLFKFWRVYKIFHQTTNSRYFSRSKSKNISLNPTLSFTALNWRVRGVK